MGKTMYLGQIEKDIMVVQSLRRIDKKVFVSFIAFLMAILARIKNLGFVVSIRKTIGLYNPVVFWITNVTAFGILIGMVMLVHSHMLKANGGLAFTVFLILIVLHLNLQNAKKGSGGQSNWP